ncbi:hypothetical protein ABVK25_012208 [Lepraria finkii]|uniref:Basic proline-rich protein n=1 Tax=Lepraria finkii TaxID=1340010 RepID=A0ABR4AKD7_9LECA
MAARPPWGRTSRSHTGGRPFGDPRRVCDHGEPERRPRSGAPSAAPAVPTRAIGRRSRRDRLRRGFEDGRPASPHVHGFPAAAADGRGTGSPGATRCDGSFRPIWPRAGDRGGRRRAIGPGLQTPPNERAENGSDRRVPTYLNRPFSCPTNCRREGRRHQDGADGHRSGGRNAPPRWWTGDAAPTPRPAPLRRTIIGGGARRPQHVGDPGAAVSRARSCFMPSSRDDLGGRRSGRRIRRTVDGRRPTNGDGSPSTAGRAMPAPSRMARPARSIATAAAPASVVAAAEGRRRENQRRRDPDVIGRRSRPTVAVAPTGTGPRSHGRTAESRPHAATTRRRSSPRSDRARQPRRPIASRRQRAGSPSAGQLGAGARSDIGDHRPALEGRRAATEDRCSAQHARPMRTARDRQAPSSKTESSDAAANGHRDRWTHGRPPASRRGSRRARRTPAAGRSEQRSGDRRRRRRPLPQRPTTLDRGRRSRVAEEALTVPAPARSERIADAPGPRHDSRTARLATAASCGTRSRAARRIRPDAPRSAPRARVHAAKGSSQATSRRRACGRRTCSGSTPAGRTDPPQDGPLHAAIDRGHARGTVRPTRRGPTPRPAQGVAAAPPTGSRRAREAIRRPSRRRRRRRSAARGPSDVPTARRRAARERRGRTPSSRRTQRCGRRALPPGASVHRRGQVERGPREASNAAHDAA